MDYAHPRIRPQVEAIKQQLRDLGWTTASPDTHAHMNHGPIDTRLQAEVLYQQWNKLIDTSWLPKTSKPQ